MTCRATALPCCFSCPETICALVDIHGAAPAGKSRRPTRKARP